MDELYAAIAEMRATPRWWRVLNAPLVWWRTLRDGRGSIPVGMRLRLATLLARLMVAP